jgi:predicted RNA binding protein with dsRBD fold (UPF0201 family)
MKGDGLAAAGKGGPSLPLEAPRLNRIEVSAGLSPTEDGERLAEALSVLFPGLRWDLSADAVTGRGTDGTGFRSAVKRAVIADAVAAHMGAPGPGSCDMTAGDGGTGDDEGPWRAVLRLNRQAVMMGRLHTGDCGTALGDVEVRLEFRTRPDRTGLVRWFLDAPDTATPPAAGDADDDGREQQNRSPERGD